MATSVFEDSPCEKCGAPASWADTNNLPWNQMLQHHVSTYLASPRMWPVGYILGSSYSPFCLEREMPNHNWRDAFEDLIALDSGGQMISVDKRKKEEEVAARLYFEAVHNVVSQLNEMLKLDQRYLSLLHRWRAFAANKKSTTLTDFLAHVNSQAIPSQEQHARGLVQTGETFIAKLKEDQTKNWPASRFKLKTQWMASLVSNGAIPDWQTILYDSSEGPAISIEKNQMNPGGGYDGQSFTELELNQQINDDIPMTLGSPGWSTLNNPYPEFEDLRRYDTQTQSDVFTSFRIPPLGLFIHRQFIRAERIRLSSGSMSIKVKLTNHFTDGNIEHKEIIDDPCRVLKDQDKVYLDFNNRAHALRVAIFEHDYLATQEPLQEHEDYEEEEYD